jgi:ribokinase
VPVTVPKIAVVGSVNIDLIATAPQLPRPGETTLGRDFRQLPGGKGANQAVAAARAGGRATMLGAIGSDAYGVTLKARLHSSGVDVTQLRVVYGASGVALIAVNDAGENTIVVVPGANAQFRGLTGDEVSAIAAADVVLCQLETPRSTAVQAAAAAREAGTPKVVLNLAPARHLPEEIWPLLDLLVANELEAEALVGSGEPAVLLDRVLERVPRAVLTRGARGAWLGERGVPPLYVPAPVIGAVDTTGAGDAFCGALAVAWGEGRDLPDAVRWASAAGACAARKLGASVALPQRAAIDELYGQTYPGHP